MYAATFPVITAEEAASHIQDGTMVALSGFSNAGTAKLVPRAIAKQAREIHSAGKPYRIRLITGSSSGNDIDEELAQAEAVSWRAPFQSAPTLRSQINSQQVQYIDMHLSQCSTDPAGRFFRKARLCNHRGGRCDQGRQSLSHHFHRGLSHLPQVCRPGLYRDKQLSLQAAAGNGRHMSCLLHPPVSIRSQSTTRSPKSGTPMRLSIRERSSA